MTGVMSLGRFSSTLLTRLDTAVSSASKRPAAGNDSSFMRLALAHPCCLRQDPDVEHQPHAEDDWLALALVTQDWEGACGTCCHHERCFQDLQLEGGRLRLLNGVWDVILGLGVLRMPLCALLPQALAQQVQELPRARAAWLKQQALVRMDDGPACSSAALSGWHALHASTTIRTRTALANSPHPSIPPAEQFCWVWTPT